MKALLLALLVCAIGCRHADSKLVEPCEACGKSISKRADICPLCGEPNPTKAKKLSLLNSEMILLQAKKSEFETELSRIISGDKSLLESEISSVQFDIDEVQRKIDELD